MLSWRSNDTVHYSSLANVTYRKRKRKDTRTRSFKKKTKLYNSIGRNQSRIPSYFKIISDIEVVINENNKLFECIRNLQQQLDHKNQSREKHTKKYIWNIKSIE